APSRSQYRGRFDLRERNTSLLTSFFLNQVSFTPSLARAIISPDLRLSYGAARPRAALRRVGPRALLARRREGTTSASADRLSIRGEDECSLKCCTAVESF